MVLLYSYTLFSQYPVVWLYRKERKDRKKESCNEHLCTFLILLYVWYKFLELALFCWMVWVFNIVFQIATLLSGKVVSNHNIWQQCMKMPSFLLPCQTWVLSIFQQIWKGKNNSLLLCVSFLVTLNIFSSVYLFFVTCDFSFLYFLLLIYKNSSYIRDCDIFVCNILEVLVRSCFE